MKKVVYTIAFMFIYCSFSQASSLFVSPNIGSIDCSSLSYYGYGDDKDGYIHKGRITLYRVGSGKGDTFELYVKSSTRYVKYMGRYYKIDGVQYVTINNIKYKTH